MDLPTFSAIDPEIWGRSFWEFLDAIVATYPKENVSPEQRQAMFQMLQSLALLLPCPNCRKHYAEFLQRHPLDTALQNRTTLLRFYFLLKKDVTDRAKGSFPIRSPNELWVTMVRRLKLARPAGAPATTTPLVRGVGRNLVAGKTNSRQVFRVPARISGVPFVPTVVSKKGCGCGKK